MQLLKQSVSVKVVVGPIVAVGDGFTPVTTLALNTADEAELMKHDAAAVTDISGNTFAAIASMDGYYNLTLSTGDTGTLGMLTLGINDDSLCLPYRAEYMVVPANAWDSLFGADRLQVDVREKGDATLALTTQEKADVNTEVDSALDTAVPVAPVADSINERVKTLDDAGAAPSAAVVADAVWDEALDDHQTAGSTSRKLDDIPLAKFTH